nr:DMT family transporter [Variovorax paradoxus]
MLVAMGCYVLNDVFVKLAAQSLPPGQVLAVRGAFATFFVLALARGTRAGWRSALQPIVGVRCGLEITTALSSVVALSLAPLATVSTLMMTAPLMIAATAMALRWEPWHGGRLLATAAGFAGVLLVIQPSARSEVPAAGLACALLCAASLAARDLVTRRIPVTVPSAVIAVATTLAVCLAGLLLGLVERWAPLTRHELGMLAAAAGCAALGNYALIVASAVGIRDLGRRAAPRSRRRRGPDRRGRCLHHPGGAPSVSEPPGLSPAARRPPTTDLPQNGSLRGRSPQKTKARSASPINFDSVPGVRHQAVMRPHSAR